MSLIPDKPCSRGDWVTSWSHVYLLQRTLGAAGSQSCIHRELCVTGHKSLCCISSPLALLSRRARAAGCLLEGCDRHRLASSGLKNRTLVIAGCTDFIVVCLLRGSLKFFLTSCPSCAEISKLGGRKERALLAVAPCADLCLQMQWFVSSLAGGCAVAFAPGHNLSPQLGEQHLCKEMCRNCWWFQGIRAPAVGDKASL